MSLIIEAPAASAAFITAGRRVSTETQRAEMRSSTGRTRSSSSRSDTGAPPLARGPRPRAGAARFTADVDDFGPLLRQPARMRRGRFRREEPAAVGEGVGRDVHHAHDQRSVQRQREAPAAQDWLRRLYALGAGAVSPCAPPSLVGFAGFFGLPEGLGGRGGLPSMMSPIWSASIVSHSSSALVMASTLSRLSSRRVRAARYC